MIKAILKESSRAIGMSYDGPFSLITRYDNLVTKFIESYDFAKGKSATIWLLIIEICLIASGAVLGIVLSHDKLPWSAKVLISVLYIIVTVIVVSTGRIVSRTVETSSTAVDHTRMMALCERLAAEVTLLTMAGDIERKDNETAISTISKFVPELSTLSPTNQNKIVDCLDPSSYFETSRGTNVIFDNLNLKDEMLHKLMEMTRGIVDLAYYLFGEHRLSAKVYLRAKKVFEGQEVQILVSFSKFPAGVRSAYSGPKATFGSSWVKARGNPSIVWQCLESGQPINISKEFDATYKSVYAICLPGRIGVLAITSPEHNAFDSKIDQWVEKALAYSTENLINRVLFGLK